MEGAGAVRMCQTEFLFVVINKVENNSVLGRVLPANVVIFHHAQQEQNQNYLDTSNCSETSWYGSQKKEKNHDSYTTPFPPSSHMPLSLVFKLQDEQATTEKKTKYVICFLIITDVIL